MSMPLTKKAYAELIAGDITWLKTIPKTLEQDHIIAILEDSISRLYPFQSKKQNDEKKIENLLCNTCQYISRKNVSYDERMIAFSCSATPHIMLYKDGFLVTKQCPNYCKNPLFGNSDIESWEYTRKNARLMQLCILFESVKKYGCRIITPPTTQICPDCNGKGEVGGIDSVNPGGSTVLCDECDGCGSIQLYYAAAEYQQWYKVNNLPIPELGQQIPVWFFDNVSWMADWMNMSDPTSQTVLACIGQPKPSDNYRHGGK